MEGDKDQPQGEYYEGNRIICLGITHDLHLEKKRHVIMFPASKVRIMRPQQNILTWLHSCETISHTKAEIYKFNKNCQQNYFYHHAIIQVVGFWLLTAEDQDQSHGSLCGIYGGQDATGISPSFPLQIIIPPILFHLSSVAGTRDTPTARVPKDSVSPQS
jgi:hypothetical protein